MLWNIPSRKNYNSLMMGLNVPHYRKTEHISVWILGHICRNIAREPRCRSVWNTVFTANMPGQFGCVRKHFWDLQRNTLLMPYSNTFTVKGDLTLRPARLPERPTGGGRRATKGTGRVSSLEMFNSGEAPLLHYSTHMADTIQNMQAGSKTIRTSRLGKRVRIGLP